MILFTHSTIWELLKILGVIKHVEEMLTFQYESKMVLAANNTVPKNVYTNMVSISYIVGGGSSMDYLVGMFKILFAFC